MKVFSCVVLFITLSLISCTHSPIVLPTEFIGESTVTSIVSTPIATPSIIQPTSTATATFVPIPTLAQFTGVPQPDKSVISNAIDTYVKSMEMAGILLNPEEIASDLVYVEVRDKASNPFIIGMTYLDPDSTQIKETLEGNYPLLTAYQEDQTWFWKKSTLRDFADMLEIDFGTQAVSWGLDDPNYSENIIAQNANFIIMGGEIDWRIILGEKNDTAEMIRQIISQLDAGQVPVIEFDYAAADRLIDFANAKDMKIQANHIFAPQYIPDDIVNELVSGKMSYEQFDQFLEFYIKTLVNHFKGRVDEYSTVNEVPANTLFASEPLRTVTINLLQRGTLERIFEWVNEADPDAILIFNDSIRRLGQEGLPDTRLLDEYVRILKLLLDNGAPIYRAGIQGHVSIYVPSTLQQIYQSVQTILDTGVPEFGFVEVTVSLSPQDADADIQEFEQIDNLYTAQAQGFRDMFEVSYAVKGSFLMFGITDAVSWDNDRQRSEAKSLIMEDEKNGYQPKPAYYLLMSAMLEKLLPSP